MKNRHRDAAFTLIEMLIALAIIVGMVGLVYGTYFGAARSARRCQEQTAAAQQARALLAQMSRQARCAYIRPAATDEVATITTSRIGTAEKAARPFLIGGSATKDDAILRLVTTASALPPVEAATGFSEAAYRYDAAARTLYYQEKTWLDARMDDGVSAEWLPLARNIAAIKLEFCDGDTWRDGWTTDDGEQLPQALRISLQTSGGDEGDTLSAVAELACHEERLTSLRTLPRRDTGATAGTPRNANSAAGAIEQTNGQKP
jgi:prepilin-type N-terminal cleavage/methylation domain-containing protein